MKSYKSFLIEATKQTVVMAFVRMQPGTTGHQLLINTIEKHAKLHSADHVVFVSKTQDRKQNPLTVEQKLTYLRKMFPGVNFVAADAQIRTFMDAAAALSKKYSHLIMVAGSDRVQSFAKALNAYNGKEYKFDSIEVVSAGERDPDSDTASGMSGTKMRAAAIAGDFEAFRRGIPRTLDDTTTRKLMSDIATGSALSEDVSQDDEGEITFNGYTTRCLHHSRDAYDSFTRTIARFKSGQIVNGDAILRALKATDEYLCVNDFRAAGTWSSDNTHHSSILRAHDAARDALNDIGEFMHHFSYWHDHEHSIQDADIATATDYHTHGDDLMNDNTFTYELQGTDFAESVNQNDALKTARLIGNILGIVSADTETDPEKIINAALRLIRDKKLRLAYPDMIAQLLSTIAASGIKYDKSLLKETTPMKYNSFVKKITEISPDRAGGHGYTLVSDDESSYMRHAKIKQQSEETNDYVLSADYETDDLDPDQIAFLDSLDDEALDDMADDIDSFDDVIDVYDDDELSLIDAETGEFVDDLKECLLTEVLSRIERIRAKTRFAKTAAKRQRKIQIALRKHSDGATINRRARRMAINMLKTRLAKKPLTSLSIGEKERLERNLQQRRQIIDRLAAKLAPRVKRIETTRLAHRTFTR